VKKGRYDALVGKRRNEDMTLWWESEEMKIRRFGGKVKKGRYDALVGKRRNEDMTLWWESEEMKI